MGTGAVWENLTHGIPVFNPNCDVHHLLYYHYFVSLFYGPSYYLFAVVFPHNLQCEVTVDIQLLLPACLIAKADRAVQDYDCIQI
jgi:hypothetical protein